MEGGKRAPRQAVRPPDGVGPQSLKLGTKKDGCTVRYLRHAVDLGLTFWKVQGCTKDKIILDLNHRPGRRLKNVSHAMLYVGLTRVKTRAGIRVLPWRGGRGPPGKRFAHLTGLAPSKELLVWFRRYGADGKYPPAA